MQARAASTFSSQSTSGYAHNDFTDGVFNPSAPSPDNLPNAMRKSSTPFENDDCCSDSDEELDAEGEEVDVQLPPPSRIRTSATVGKTPRTSRTKSKSPLLPAVSLRTPISKAPRAAISNSAVTNNIVAVFTGGCAKARAMKSRIPSAASMAMPISEPKGSRPAEQDPENHMIVDLRCNESYSWCAIAKLLNQERVKQGSEPTWTESAVYSRFKRNAPKIAEMNGQLFDHQDFIHMKNEKKKKGPIIVPLQSLTEPAQIALMNAVKETQEDFWVHVADVMERQTGHKYTAEECAQWYGKI